MIPYPKEKSETELAFELYSALKTARYDVHADVVYDGTKDYDGGRLDLAVFDADKKIVVIIEVKKNGEGWAENPFNTLLWNQYQKYIRVAKRCGAILLLHDRSTTAESTLAAVALAFQPQKV